MPWMYHYAGRPDLSAQRVRDVVYGNFGTGFEGVSTLKFSHKILNVKTSMIE
jgi:hypothetical protein